MKRKQYRKYKIKVRLDEEENYFYGLIYRPDQSYLTSTSGKNDESSVMAQAENIIDEDLRKRILKKGIDKLR